MDSYNSIASEISKIGSALNNDFISSLGSFAQSVIDIANDIRSYKSASSEGNLLGQVSAGLGIAGTVVGFVSGLFGNSGKTQMSAAEKMDKAVSEFKSKIEGMTVQEISGQAINITNELSKQYEKLNQYQNITGDYSGTDKISQTINNLNAQLATIAPEIKDALNITWQDFASNVKSAFDADNLDDFYSTFKKNLSDNIKDALVSAFLQSTAMKTMFESLSTDIYNSLASVGFDPSKLTTEQTNAWQSQIEALSKSGGAFYEVLQKLGLAGTNTADALNSAANTINSIPQGVKVSLYRYQAMTPTAMSAVENMSTGLPNVNVYIGNEKIANIVTKVTAANNVKSWGA